MPTKTLHALLIGIDRYSSSIPTLHGCVNDMHAFRDYLARQCKNDEFEFKPYVLEDESATRDAILQGFHHFQAAKDGDVCVFYFSGHGSRIPAPQFWEASDGLNECVLCAESTLEDASGDLVDKELSWLIHEAVGQKAVHFLAIMDCCHSGTNTRDGDFQISIRQVQNRNIPRLIEDYVGYQDYPQDTKGLYSAPKAQHISFGACRAYQTAKEISLGGQARGAFTASLIEALETTSVLLSYADLEARVAKKIANRTFDQLPQLDPVAGANTGLSFLGGAVVPQRRFSIVWNTNAFRWELDAGQIDGIVGPQSAKVSLPDGTAIQVAEALANTSYVSGTDGLDPSKQYEANVQLTGVLAKKIGPAPGTNESQWLDLVNGHAVLKPIFVAIAADTADAEYWIHIQANKYSLTQAGSDRPLFNPVENDVPDFLRKVNAVFQWQHVLNLENPLTKIQDNEFELELLRSEGKNRAVFETYEPVPDWQNPPPFCWTPPSAGNSGAPGYALRVSNTGTRDLHFAALNLSGRYEIDNQFLTGEKIAPGQEAWLAWTDKTHNTHKGIGLNIESKHWDAGFTDMTDYIKILVSTAEIATARFNQPGLDLTETMRPKDTTRDTMTEEEADMDQSDWTTRQIPLRIIKPQPTKAIVGGIVSQFNSLRLSAPIGFSAKAGLAGEAEASRGFVALPAPINCPGFRPFSLTPGFSRAAGLSVLELRDIQGSESITPETPLEITVEDVGLLEANELVLPFGYDPETGIWYPLGLPGDAGTPAKIGTLPLATPASDRSIGGSLLLFFQKISVGKPLIGSIATWLSKKKNLFQLAAVKVAADESFESIILDEAQIRLQVQKAKRILLYIHGIIGDTEDSVKLVRRLRDPNNPDRCLQDNYDLILTFDYENLGTGIDEIARHFRDGLAAVGLSPGHGKTFHIVAHSMGGLLTRWFIERENGHQVVSALVLAGTPSGGSKLHRAYDFGQLLLTRAVNFIPAQGIVGSIVGWLARQSGITEINKTFLMMKPGSDFLNILAASADPGIPYFLVAGNTQLTNKEQKTINGVLKRLGYTSLDLLFGEPNDIAVAVTDVQQLPGARHIPPEAFVAACDHTTYFNSAAGLEVLGKALWKLQ